jgi:capsular polysaccharide transport system ATP-binding protein
MLLALICGAEPPDEGSVDCTSKVSWPIPSTGFLTPTSPVTANLRFIARLYGLDQDKFVREVLQLGEIEEHANLPLMDCPRFVKAQMAFAMSMWFDFDIYLFDDKVVSAGKPFQARAKQILEARLRGKGVLVTTSSSAIASQYCDTAFVIDGGRAEHYTDMKAALKHFRSLDKDAAPDREQEQEEEEDDDEEDM